MRTLLIMLCLALPISAHTVDYKVSQEKGVVVTVFLGDEPASYSEYEVFAPDNMDDPVQLGRLDSKGRVTFLPDAVGTWIVKVEADSQHGLHGVKAEVEVKDDMTVQDNSAPPIARHTRLIVGVSILFGLFGLISLFRPRSGPQSVAK